MRILGRILIILAVFALVMGATYLIVNSRSASTPGFGPAGQRFASPDGDQEFPTGARPAFPGREGNEFRGERRSGGWLFGTIKNVAIIGIIVALIVIPRSWLQKRKRAAQIAAG